MAPARLRGREAAVDDAAVDRAGQADERPHLAAKARHGAEARDRGPAPVSRTRVASKKRTLLAAATRTPVSRCGSVLLRQTSKASGAAGAAGRVRERGRAGPAGGHIQHLLAGSCARGRRRPRHPRAACGHRPSARSTSAAGPGEDLEAVLVVEVVRALPLRRDRPRCRRCGRRRRRPAGSAARTPRRPARRARARPARQAQAAAPSRKPARLLQRAEVKLAVDADCADLRARAQGQRGIVAAARCRCPGARAGSARCSRPARVAYSGSARCSRMSAVRSALTRCARAASLARRRCASSTMSRSSAGCSGRAPSPGSARDPPSAGRRHPPPAGSMASCAPSRTSRGSSTNGRPRWRSSAAQSMHDGRDALLGCRRPPRTGAARRRRARAATGDRTPPGARRPAAARRASESRDAPDRSSCGRKRVWPQGPARRAGATALSHRHGWPGSCAREWRPHPRTVCALAPPGCWTKVQYLARMARLKFMKVHKEQTSVRSIGVRHWQFL